MQRLLVVLAAGLFLPVAAAAGGEEAEGRLRMPDGVSVRGDLGLHGPGIFELDRTAGDAGIAVSFGALADGVLRNRTREKVHVGLPGLYEPSVVTSPGSTNRSIEFDGAGRVENVRCRTECRIALVAYAGQATLGAEGPMDATLRPTVHERAFSTSVSPSNRASQLQYVVPAGAVELRSEQFADVALSASGRVLLVIADAAFDLVAADGTRAAFDARWENETVMGAAGQPVQVRHHTRHAELVLDGAALAVAPGEPFRVSFPGGADGRLDGALASPAASGMLAVAGKRHELDRDAVDLEGSLAVRLAGTPPRLLGEAPASDVEVRGEATRAVVSGANVLPWRPSGVAEAGGGLLALVGLAFLGRLFAVPLYHRLRPSDLLANPNRRRIHDAIRAQPGVDVGTLVATVGLSRVLVRHHLRMLEAHKLVRATVWRRRRTYALVGALPAAGAGLAACELKDATRRRVASAVAQSGGATQKDLARALGLSQRLVSYHLSCLGDSSLVRAEGRNPRVYVATPALAHALANEEAVARAVKKNRALAHGLEKGEEGVVAVVATPA